MRTQRILVAIISALLTVSCSTDSPVSTNMLKICDLAGNSDAYSDNNWPDGYAVAEQVTAPIDGEVNSIMLLLAGETQYAVSLYEDESGKPGELLSQSMVSSTSVQGWASASIIPVSVIQGKKYWIVVAGSAAGVSCVDDTVSTCLYSRIPWKEIAGSGFPQNGVSVSWCEYDTANKVYMPVCCR